jgi:hypothetical protein
VTAPLDAFDGFVDGPSIEAAHDRSGNPVETHVVRFEIDDLRHLGKKTARIEPRLRNQEDRPLKANAAIPREAIEPPPAPWAGDVVG